MQQIMIRIMTTDYDSWLKVHHEYLPDRQSYGITNGPVYRDINNPNAALVHMMVEDLPRAMEFFGSPKFREAAARAKVTGREFYLAEQRQ